MWLAAAVVPVLATRHPGYLAVTLAVTVAVHRALSRGRPATASWDTLLVLGLGLVLLTVLVPPLLVHWGETVLFTLPALSLPLPGVSDQPVLGGPVTLESLAYGISTGLGLMCLLVVFATFNTAADAYRLLRALPRSLARSGVVLSIAVTFVPQMMVAQKEIREAQALRGHRFRKLRDLAPLFVTLLAEGLERSITLAESMEARGFSRPGGKEGTSGRLGLLLAFGLLVAGAVVRTWLPDRWWGDALLLLGVAALLVALSRLGRKAPRTRLRPASWSRRDSLLAVASALSLTLVLAVRGTGGGDLGWYPYPRVELPELDPLVLLGLLLLLVPALAVRLPPSEGGSSGEPLSDELNSGGPAA